MPISPSFPTPARVGSSKRLSASCCLSFSPVPPKLPALVPSYAVPLCCDSAAARAEAMLCALSLLGAIVLAACSNLTAPATSPRRLHRSHAIPSRHQHVTSLSSLSSIVKAASSVTPRSRLISVRFHFSRSTASARDHRRSADRVAALVVLRLIKVARFTSAGTCDASIFSAATRHLCAFAVSPKASRKPPKLVSPSNDIPPAPGCFSAARSARRYIMCACEVRPCVSWRRASASKDARCMLFASRAALKARAAANKPAPSWVPVPTP